MVARITSGPTPEGALYYNKAKTERGEAVFLDCCNTLLMRGEEFVMRLAMETFAPYLAANRRTRMPTFHVSLNPSPEDRLSDDELRDIAREYMERMGYGAQPYFVFKHRDIAREHLHIVSVRVDAQGRKLRHDFEARTSMTVLRELERKYELHPAVKGSAEQQTQALRKADYRASDIRQQIACVVRAAMHTCRCSSFGEFRTLLERYNVGIEERTGVVAGRSYAGIVYHVLSDEGYRTGIPIKAGHIGRDVGYEALQRYYERSRQYLLRPGRLDDLRGKVSQALRRSNGEEEFIARLAQERITAILRHTDKGRIYGATFLDHAAGIVANGSLLGKAFAANALEGRFRGERGPAETEPSRMVHTEGFVEGMTQGLSDLLEVHEQEEIEMQRRKRRKRRKRIR